MASPPGARTRNLGHGSDPAHRRRDLAREEERAGGLMSGSALYPKNAPFNFKFVEKGKMTKNEMFLT